MKKTLSLTVSILLILCCATAQQQIMKGRWFISHSIGGFAYTSDHTKIYNGAGVLEDDIKDTRYGFFTSFSGPDYGDIEVSRRNYESNTVDTRINRFNIVLEPVAGKFINDNLLLGASIYINIDNSKQERKDADVDGKSKKRAIGIGPLVRYYFAGTDKARFFAGLESRYTFTNYDDENLTTTGANTTRQAFDVDWRTLMVNPHAGYAWFVGKHWSIELRADYRYETEDRDQTLAYQVNGVMQTGYPQITRHDRKINRISLNAGIRFSF